MTSVAGNNNPLFHLANSALTGETAPRLSRSSSQGLSKSGSIARNGSVASVSRGPSSAYEWRKFLTVEERQGVRLKIKAAYKSSCTSYDDLLDTVMAIEEELLHISAPSRLDYFKSGCQFDKRVQDKRKQIAVDDDSSSTSDRKRSKHEDDRSDRMSSGGPVSVSQDCDSQECELTQEA